MYNYGVYNKNVIDKNVEAKNVDVFSSYDGFINGTLFKPLYEPYKNYVPERITGKNEKEKAILSVMMYYAGLHDLTLYLDVHPEDKDALRLREEYFDKYQVSKKEYEKIGSPYTWDANFPVNKGFTYAMTPFQWEVRK